MAAATTSAVAGSSGVPVCTAAFIALNAFFDSDSSIVARLNTSVAQISLSGPPAAGVGTTPRLVTSLMAWSRISLPLMVGSFVGTDGPTAREPPRVSGT